MQNSHKHNSAYLESVAEIRSLPRHSKVVRHRHHKVIDLGFPVPHFQSLSMFMPTRDDLGYGARKDLLNEKLSQSRELDILS
jgi:hypothetical protein